MFLIELVCLLAVIAAAIMLVQGVRKIPVQYAKRIVGNKQYGGARQYIPLKVNAANVMPIIFAQAIMFIPITIVGFSNAEEAGGITRALIDHTSFLYNVIFAILILLFTYFYTAITINPNQMLFGINQGAIFDDIRIAHADTISELNLDGYAIGGLAVGESHEEMYHILDVTVPHLPENKPTYLMGVGTPANILEAVDRGVDFFDCVYPTRNGRHGHLYTNHGKINLLNAKFELDSRPIEEGCQCPACRTYSRAYIRHLLKAKEMLGYRLCVLHNLYFYNKMMEEIREAIEKGCYQEYKQAKLAGFENHE